MKKRIFVIITMFLMVSALVCSLAACKKANNDDTILKDPDKPPIVEESDVAALLPNYTCEITYFKDGTNSTLLKYTVMPEMLMLTGRRGDSDVDEKMILDYKKQTYTIINDSVQKAMRYRVDANIDTFQTPGKFLLADGFLKNIPSTWEKKGSVKMDSRPATEYRMTVDGSEKTCYIDDSTGICLFYEAKNADGTSTKWEVKKLKNGGVTAADFAVPQEYQMSDLSEIAL